MRLHSLLPILALVSLVACDDEATPEVCGLPSVETSQDTLIGATVDGRRVKLGAQPGYRGMSLTPWDLDGSADSWKLGINGVFWRLGYLEAIQIDLAPFTGVGAYALDANSYPESRFAAYTCYGVTTHESWWAFGTPGDTVWVTAYDSVSGEIEGRFAFLGRPVLAPGNDALSVTAGEFQGSVLPEAAP